MFRWYKNATICYVYLSDYDIPRESTFNTQKFRQCRWFTRGWTLQEFIAPRCVQFYAKDWRLIAAKDDIRGLLSDITGIDQAVLRGANLADVSVARRMSWASRRQTSRGEDMAYALLGIFDVNIPLIYGEGRLKSFQRLQEAIMNTTHDQSLFAWGRLVGPPINILNEKHFTGREPLVWKSPRDREPLLGLFAESPAEFESSGDISPVDHGYAHALNRNRPPAMVNGGVLVNLVVLSQFLSVTYWDDPMIAMPDVAELAILLCRVGNTGSRLIGLGLHKWGDGYRSRTKELFAVDQFISHERFQSLTRSLHLMPHRPFRLCHGDIVLRQWVTSFKAEGVKRHKEGRGPAWRQRCFDRLVRLEENSDGDEKITFFYETRAGQGIAITLKRLSKKQDPLGNLMIGAYLTESRGYRAGDNMGMIPWVPKQVATLSDPQSKHIMMTPSDYCQLKFAGGIRIQARVDRMALDQGGHVDVMDFFMYKKGQSLAWRPVSIEEL